MRKYIAHQIVRGVAVSRAEILAPSMEEALAAFKGLHGWERTGYNIVHNEEPVQ